MAGFWTHWQVFAAGAAVFAGLTAVFGKLGVAQMPSNLATLIRTVVIVLMIGVVVTVRREWRRPAAMPARDVVFLVLSAVATGLSWMCYYRALQLGPASRVAPVDKLSVVVAVLLGIVVLGEPLSWRVVVGGVLVTAGAVVMAT